jgi:FkbM family methyltransferase
LGKSIEDRNKELKRLLKTVLAKLGYRVQGTRYVPRQLLDPGSLRYLEFDDVVCRRMFEFGPSLTFIQIGVFDGTTHDPLRKFIDKCGWRGILIEPQSQAANKLRELYCGNERILILQAAVDGKPGRRPLYTVNSETAPAWAGGLASFERECVLKHSPLIPGLADMIREEIVECITFNDILQRVNFERIDLLQVDTEGADAHILYLFPFDRVQPAIIHWEIKHLSKAEREDCLSRLLAYGYRFAPSGDEDMIALLF